ncbi:hypothetical protein LEP1GSC051_0995 [Leptospira sp. P2653]|nr:hypothetical protein LEP1GSC051_0995 [Leptospira sp. P2653]EMN45765.1 hypothetical protein LEP1GSC086_2501 [Leptospira weilii str. LNT 1234]
MRDFFEKNFVTRPLRSLASLLDFAPRRLTLASEHPVPRKRFFAPKVARNALPKFAFESGFCIL